MIHKNNDRYYSLFKQIQSVPILLTKAKRVDQTLNQHFIEMQAEARNLVHELGEQKEQLLKKFNGLLLPAAKEVLSELMDEAENLQFNLDETIQKVGGEQTSEMDWVELAKGWVQIYSKWQDHKGLVEKVLQVAVDHTKKLIDRDIKVVHEYHEHSKARVSDGHTETFDERLHQTIEEALTELNELKKTPKAVDLEWLSGIHVKRANVVDDILMRIDSAVKEREVFEEAHDPVHFLELEAEISFMEQEMVHLKKQLANPKSLDVALLQEVLEGMQNHIKPFIASEMPRPLRNKFDLISKEISEALQNLQG